MHLCKLITHQLINKIKVKPYILYISIFDYHIMFKNVIQFMFKNYNLMYVR